MFDFSNVNKPTAVLEIIILMLVAAIIAFVVAWIYWSRRYKRLQAEFDQHKRESKEAYALLLNNFNESEAALAKTKAELEDCNLRGKGLVRDLGNEKSAHAGTQKALSDMTGDRNGLKANVATLESKVADMTAAATLLQTEKAGLQADLAKAEETVKTRDASIKKLQAELKAAASVPAKVEAEAEATKKAAKPAKGKKRNQEEVLKDIEAKRETINFGRIGSASASDKDDLKLIKGIGPFIEKKLNALGIFTFLQISKFTEEDETSVTKAIEFFPGRIQRDNWTAQAKEFAKGK